MISLFLILTLFFSSQASASIKLPHMNVVGNNVFDEEAVIQISGIHLDPELTPTQLKEHIQSTGYFEDVRVTKSSNDLNIYVKEKITWFAIPYLSSDSKIYGIGAGKAGLWGQNGFAAARFQLGNYDHEASFIINDDSFLNTPWVLGMSLDFENSYHRIFSDRVVIDRFSNYFYGLSSIVGYHLAPDFKLVMQSYLEQHRFEETKNSITSGLQLSHRLKMDYGKVAIDEGLLHGASIQAYFEITNPISDFHFYKYGVSAITDIYSNGDLNWTVKPKIEIGSNMPRYSLFEVGGVKLRGFPSQYFRDSEYASIQNNFLLTSLTVSDFKLRPLLFADWAYIDHGNRECFGSGFLVYFKSVAVPTLEFFAGYGLNPKGFSVSATVGPQF